ncbi:MAG: hypothetical protein KIS92_02950 [Planctomycetota bacterium]|nr:hypothetical protein [Planctomycetota bacterium]
MRIFLAVLGVLALIGAARAAEQSVLLADFEAPGDKAFEKPPESTIVAEHAKQGAHALKFVHGGEGYPGFRIDAGAAMDKLHEHFERFPLLTMDLFNPQDFPVPLGASAGDAQSKDYGSRFNEDGLSAPPGWSTLRLNLTGLLCSNSNNWHERRPLNAKDLRFLVVFMHPHTRGKPVTLFVDRVRLENDGLPKVEGLRAFDFGPAVSGVFPGFTAVNERTNFDAKAGYGWVNPGRHARVANPDMLGGDFGSGGSFGLKVEPGAYVVQMVIDAFGEWQGPQVWSERSVAINGKTVLEEKTDGPTFLKNCYLQFEETDDLPGTDLWEERVKPALPVRTFEAEAGADGMLSIVAKNDRGPAPVAWLVVYPKAKADEGAAYMKTLDARRKEFFESAVNKILPKPNAEAFAPEPAETARGFALFACSTQADVTAAYVPSAEERKAGLNVAACPGEREAAQFGFHPFKKLEKVSVSGGELRGPGGAAIPAGAIQVRKVRHFYARRGNSLVLVPRILQSAEAMTLTPGVSQGVWVTLKVPADAAPGEYAGEIRIEAGGAKSSLPVRLTVRPFALDKADDVTISCTGTTGGHWRHWGSGLEERWWQVAEEALRDQAEHGMNAVTGGPGFRVKAVKDGKAEIDFAEADRWMKLANTYGLTGRGDAYQGLDAHFGFYRSFNADCMKTNEEQARKAFGVGFEDLIRATYAEVERHAAEQHWPPRVYYLLDEPRPEFGNVASALEFTQLHVRAAPNTKFSGYYSPGDGREPYFATMPVSIAHHSEASLKICRENGKEAWTYTAGGERHDIGRWLFFAKRKGLTGYLRNGYQYVNSSAYYDYSDVEGSWAQTYPSARGIASTVGWERTAQGVNDYRYLKTLQGRISAAKQSGAKPAETKAAEAFMAATLSALTLDKEDSAELTPAGWVEFRAELAKHIQALAPAGR